jgi:primary-amine oxidase
MSDTLAVRVIAFACILPASTASAQKAEHPLDPLGFQEYWTVLEVLREAGHFDEATRFTVVKLHEPPKDLVWKWSPGQDSPREAFAVVRQGAETHEAIIDLNQRKLTSWVPLVGVQPGWIEEEYGAMIGEVKKHPDFISALRKRGITDLTFLQCFEIPPSYLGTDEQRGRRIAHVGCLDTRGARNTWPREIPGLSAVVDLNARKVLRIVDEGVTPVTKANADYDPASIGPARDVPSPIHIEQPLGPGFRISGHIVDWQKWRFHVRPDPRVGAILSTVSYNDSGRRRPILYEGHLSEMFVPYMDPSFVWAHRTYFDAGENPGPFLRPLLHGLDCPENAVYMDDIAAGADGRPRTNHNVICLFEQEAGAIAWRHADSDPESRRKRDLVVRSATVQGNYDYVFDWAFQQDGSIRVSVGATGIAETKSVAQADAASPVTGGTGRPPAEPGDAYGRFVDQNLVAVNHDHYFSFRIDLDVDGPVNNFVADRLVTKTLPPENPRRSIWVREPMLARNEMQGMLHMDMDKPALWRVLSTTQKNHVGYSTSYQLMPEMTGSTLLTPDDYPRQRAGFIEHHLWVTPYKYEERYAAGDYPTLSTPGQGLPAWTKANRKIEETDIVLWYTIGMHHMVRNEDWPVMPTLWHSFELRPFDFFDRNPALDLPRQ